ncbi:MAG: NAD(P)-binding domain-containing protein [Lautropia sp.]
MRHTVVVVGAGQAGLSISRVLTDRGIEHVVFERGRIAESWRSARWDSFTLVTPNWMTRLPGKSYDGPDADGFMAREAFVGWLEDYAREANLPVRCGVEVQHAEPLGNGFALSTSAGRIECDNVVIATATYQTPAVPPVAAALPADLLQVHAAQYRNPAQLPQGAVLVVGSGQSGCQIADELRRHGRKVYLATGRAGRLLRRYRGRDGIAWQHAMGLLDRTPDMLESLALRHRGDPHLTGAGGGRTLNLHRFAEDGMVLLGRLEAVEGRTLRFGSDLRANLAFADDYAAEFCAKIDSFITGSGIDAPPAAATNSDFGGPLRAEPASDPRTIDIDVAGIACVVWGTGFKYDFTWIDVPGGLDEFGYPIQRRGIGSVPGLFYLGLNWLHKRKSGIVFGVGEDAEFLAHAIAERVATPRSDLGS